jgi:hypothetical protein
MALACGGGDDAGDDDEPSEDAGASQAASRAPSAEDIAAALAEAGVFIDDGGITIGDTRIGVGDDGVTIDDASLVSFTDGGVVFGSGDAAITIRTEGTCAELLACCESLTEESEHSQCISMHDQLAAIPLSGGDLLCAQLVPSLCP